MMTVSSLNYHKRNFHSNKKFKCKKCNRYFKYLKNLQYHVKASHGRVALLAAEKKAVIPSKKKIQQKRKNSTEFIINGIKNDVIDLHSFQFVYMSLYILFIFQFLCIFMCFSLCLWEVRIKFSC